MDNSIFHQRLAEFGEVLRQERAVGRADSDKVLEAHRIRTWAHWILDDLDACWQEYEDVRRFERRQDPKNELPPMWDGQEFPEQTLLVEAVEGGYGDLFQYLRFVLAAQQRGGRVVIVTKPELVRLFESSFGDVGIECVDHRDARPQADFQIDYFRLPFAMQCDRQTMIRSVPYIHPPMELVAAWRQRLSSLPRPWIGLCWINTMPQQPHDERYVPLTEFAPVIESCAGTFVCLEKENRGYEIEPSGFGARLVDFGDELTDFAQTAALMAPLDLIITIDTSVAHLAGAMGKPTFMVMMHEYFEGWLMGDDAVTVPWYPTLRLCLNPQTDRWHEQMADLAAAADQALHRGGLPGDAPKASTR